MAEGNRGHRRPGPDAGGQCVRALGGRPLPGRRIRAPHRSRGSGTSRLHPAPAPQASWGRVGPRRAAAAALSPSVRARPGASDRAGVCPRGEQADPRVRFLVCEGRGRCRGLGRRAPVDPRGSSSPCWGSATTAGRLPEWAWPVAAVTCRVYSQERSSGECEIVPVQYGGQQ